MRFILCFVSIGNCYSSCRPSCISPPLPLVFFNGIQPTDSPMLHLRLLLFGFQTALTTAVCVVEYSSWPELSATEKSSLGGLYIPYFAFGESKAYSFPHTSLPRQTKGERQRVMLRIYFADTNLSAAVMFADMYGRVKARLMAAGGSSQKSKSP